ncbi:MAG: hypothetical protein MJ137_08360 [Clostridia bacterium]|nr:hypothetical protein [Clostridia bacterium]
MYDFSVTMALVDFIPVILFAVSAVLMMRDFYYQLPKYGFALLAAGTVDVFSAGFLKAVWKLLYAAGICNFEALNKLFLPTQSIGFLLAGIAMIILVSGKNGKKTTLMAVAPPLFEGTMVFISMMVLGLGSICTCLSVYAAKKKKAIAVPLFVLAFFGSMAMGYTARLDSTAAWVNWTEQGINCFSQLCLMTGMIIIRKTSKKQA